MIKKLFFSMCFFLSILILLNSQNQSKSEYDGTFWGSLSKDRKITVVYGYKMGQISLIEMILKIKEYFGNKIEKTINEEEKKIFGYHKLGIEFLHKYIFLNIIADNYSQPEQIMEGVDHFYEDNANKQIFLFHAIAIVEMRIKGMPGDVIQSEIYKHRRDDKKDWDK